MKKELLEAIKNDTDFYNTIKEGCYNTYGDKIPDGNELSEQYIKDKLEFDAIKWDGNSKTVPQRLAYLTNPFLHVGYAETDGQGITITSLIKHL
jgi:hypothetical protein